MPTQLNRAQHEAVHTLSGPLLVLAGAGTGKTRVITYRIAELIRTGTVPGRIWAVTFTNKAAKEMRERVGALIQRRMKDPPLVSTFHAYCVRILRRQIHRLGYPPRFPIYDQGDQESLARRVLRELRMPSTSLRPSDATFLISSWKSRGLGPAEASAEAETDREHLAAAAYRRYQKALQQAGAVDFDDLLLCTERIFREFPEACAEEASRFDHILVDEYQDTNGPQYRVVRALAERHRNLCVVGDDDQSIYAWRGADVSHILRFTRDWPEAKVVRLEENYRCTDAILACANRLIAFNKQRYQKVLRAARPGGAKPRVLQFKTGEHEARGVVDEIRRELTRPGRDPRDFAILFRTNEQPRAFETELRKANLPYVLIGSRSFFDRREVKDVLAFLRLLDAPDDEESLRRMLNVPPRGLGEKSIDTLLHTAQARQEPLWKVLSHRELPPGLSSHARQGIQRFAGLIADHHRQVRERALPLNTILHEFLLAVNYRAEIEHQYPEEQDREIRWQMVEEIVNSLAGYEREAERPSLRQFLDDLALGVRDFDSDKETQLGRNAVVLMTLHSAKGLEFPHVYMVGMENGILPHKRSVQEGDHALDEERRLCYVGITRAQEELTFTMSLSRLKWGKPREAQPSLFLYEALGMAERAKSK